MKDISIIYLTVGKVPQQFAAYQQKLLLGSIEDSPLIIISRSPLVFGHGENIIDSDKMGYENIYRQILRGAKMAKTDYIAVAEDDVLYCKNHFEFFRPPLDTFAYNQHRWALFTWGDPVYNIRQRKSNCSMIAPRKLAIEALEERFKKYPNGMPEKLVGELGRSRVERGLGVMPRKSVEVFSDVGIIHFNHSLATEDRQKRQRKNLGQIKAYDIPVWGKAEALVQKFY